MHLLHVFWERFHQHPALTFLLHVNVYEYVVPYCCGTQRWTDITALYLPIYFIIVSKGNCVWNEVSSMESIVLKKGWKGKSWGRGGEEEFHHLRWWGWSSIEAVIIITLDPALSTITSAIISGLWRKCGWSLEARWRPRRPRRLSQGTWHPNTPFPPSLPPPTSHKTALIAVTVSRLHYAVITPNHRGKT